MDDAALRARRLATQRAYYRLAGQASPGARLIDGEAVTASIVPAVPERSVCNSVVYSDADALLDSIEELAAAYEDAGVTAWTVWVPEEDVPVANALSERGHVLDAIPEAMGMTLESVERPPAETLPDWYADAPVREVTAINDRAYQFEGDPFTRAFGGLPGDQIYTYVARVDGEPACGILTHDHEDDCGVWAVATLPQWRGLGLTTRLLAHALADARDRGCLTTTLEATQMGKPVYERMGYRPLGVVQMWELRRATASPRT